MLAGPLQGRRVAVEREPMTLGRGADCTLVIPDEEMALRHAVIEHRMDGLFVRDLGAMGGVLVNGHEVRERRLRHGDEVELGRTRFLVQALVQADVSGGGGSRGSRRLVRLVLLIVLLGAVSLYGYRKWQEIGETVAKPGPVVVSQAAVSAQPPVETDQWATVAEVAGGAETSAPPSTLVTAAVAKANDEIRAMREDLTELRKHMQELTAAQATASNTPQAVAVTSVVSAVKTVVPVQPGSNSLEIRVQGMLAEAGRLIADGRDADADRLLDGIEVISPGNLEAYESRARLFEKRRMPERAMEQWLELIDLGKGSPYYDRAVTEFGRLDAQLSQLPSPGKGMLKIAIEHHKFPESADFSEMRVLDITLAPVSEAEAVDAKAVRTEVTFYDEDLATGRIVATRAMVAISPLKPEVEWQAGDTRMVTATYAVPKKAGAAGPRSEQYYGYAVRVFLGGKPQAEEARPRSLLSMASAVASSVGKQVDGQ